MSETSISAFPLMMNEVQVDINMDLPESDIQDMLCRINQLNEIRMDTNFRMVFLFQEKSCSDFIKVVQNRQPRMLKFLEDLEQCAVQLDRMNKGAKISSITGSSVGAVGGVLSIVGLALSPVTAGASLGLLLGGTAMGILSGTNSAVTTFTEIGVNHKQRNKANDVLQKFMEDVQSIHDCLGEVINQPTADKEVSFYKDMCIGFKQVGSVGLSIRSLVKDASDVKLIKSKNLIAGSGKMVAQESKALSNASKMASEIPEVGQAAFKGSLALSKTARAGAIALNALFLGMDIYSICQDSISLAKANKTEISQFIRARASLLKSEMNSWENICNSLNEGLKTEDKKKAFLEMPFYTAMKRQVQKKQSVSFENKQRDRELKFQKEFYLIMVVLGGLLGFAAWVCGAFSN
uniref:Apolipoprotein L n=1 Tax=Oreochromis niloticus TaxID=8128 RepID=A0A669F2I1_ORENI